MLRYIRDNIMIPGLGRSFEEGMATLSVFLPDEPHERSLQAYSPANSPSGHRVDINVKWLTQNITERYNIDKH